MNIYGTEGLGDTGICCDASEGFSLVSKLRCGSGLSVHCFCPFPLHVGTIPLLPCHAGLGCAAQAGGSSLEELTAL